MNIESTPISCGVCQLYNLYKLKEKQFLDDIFNSHFEDYIYDEKGPAYYIWSDTTKNKNGDKLAAIIKKHKLGVVQRAKPAINLVTGNEITVFTWRVNQKAMLAFAKKKYKKLVESNDEDGYY